MCLVYSYLVLNHFQEYVFIRDEAQSGASTLLNIKLVYEHRWFHEDPLTSWSLSTVLKQKTKSIKMSFTPIKSASFMK